MPDTPAPAHRIIVHRWDVRAPLPGPVVDEIRRAHRLRNDLVQVEREHADAVAPAHRLVGAARSARPGGRERRWRPRRQR